MSTMLLCIWESVKSYALDKKTDKWCCHRAVWLHTCCFFFGILCFCNNDCIHMWYIRCYC